MPDRVPPPSASCTKRASKSGRFSNGYKRHLHIKQFYGASEHAVKVDIWTAVSAYLLVAIVKKRVSPNVSLYTLLQIFSVTLFEKTPLIKVLLGAKYDTEDDTIVNQLNLIDS